MLFQLLLKSIVHNGSLRLITADGKSCVIGDGTPPRFDIKLHRKSLEWTLALNPELRVGEAYMNGRLTFERGDVRDFLQLIFSNFKNGEVSPMLHWIERLNGRMQWLKQFNPVGIARRNAAYHYDLPDQVYQAFLGPDRQYSCGYFTDPENSLEQAQLDKKHHIASKLWLNRPGLKILDIGSGWGGLALYLARQAQGKVTGVTLSVEQYKISRERARAEGLNNTCNFQLRDYRQEKGPYDRIVSVGMFEHVGKKNYDEFFANIRRLLADDGVCLLHAVGRFRDPGPVNAFIRKYIFPGADVATLSEVLPHIERSGLYVTDIEILRLHYAETLKNWSDRFAKNRNDIIKSYGEKFYRKWQFYLISCEMGFRYENLMVFQIQLAKKLGSVPLTRDYMYDWERTHKQDKGLTSLSA